MVTCVTAADYTLAKIFLGAKGIHRHRKVLNGRWGGVRRFRILGGGGGGKRFAGFKLIGAPAPPIRAK